MPSQRTCLAGGQGDGMVDRSGHSGRALACAFSPDGSTVLSGSEGSTFMLWNANSGAEKSP